ncbi:MAG: aspartate/glutamate racemase family protein [Rhizobiaceae bacterium]
MQPIIKVEKASDRPRRRRPVHGARIGIIVLDTGFQRLPGDVANALTWRFPVQYHVVTGVRPQDVIEGAPEKILPAFYDAIDRLTELGVDGIATSCGFLAMVHPQLRAYSGLPIASSSLMQIPLVLQTLPADKTVGVIVSDRKAITDNHFINVGAPVGLPLGELAFDGPIRANMRNNASQVSYAAQERDALETVERMLAETPSIGALVSECANLPPYSQAIERTLGVPVYDVVSLVEWLHAGLMPRGFHPETS